ncbi:MAG: hypothetical protein JSW61_13910 [Candidatus Thorarchaeota archaeon]|nr:MAG: hypothetical protein JSW61_13910 [Candidatus Thorarchaeota archaeon]
MNKEDFSRALELVGINLHDGRSRILRAMLRAQPSLGTQISFKEMYQQLGREEGGRGMARPLVYRYLKSLEKDGLVAVDRSAYRHTYSVGLETLTSAIENLRLRALEKLRLEFEAETQRQEAVVMPSAASIAAEFMIFLVGKPEKPIPKTVTGLEDIQRLIDTEIYATAKEGDVIRATMDWITHDRDVEKARYQEAQRLLDMGVEYRTLIRRPWALDTSIGKMRRRFYQEAKDRYKVTYRFMDKREWAYQLVGKNRDGIVLVVSEDPITAIWIPRSTNPMIVDDALDSFDQEFEEAQDMLDGSLGEGETEYGD